MKRVIVLVALSLLLTAHVLVATADVDYPLMGAAGVYTLVNLHPDEERQRLYSVNYQQPGLLLRWPKVKLESLGTRGMKVRVLRNDRRNENIFPNWRREPIPKHLDKVFGTKCDAKLDGMSEVDRQGIRAGSVLAGMTKRGVTLAIGYPPEHATPSLDSDIWTYWRNRFGKMT